MIKLTFLKGTFIGENIRLIADSIVKYTAAKNIPGLLIFLYFEKACGPVECSFLHKSLQHYNFGSICYSGDETLSPQYRKLHLHQQLGQ